MKLWFFESIVQSGQADRSGGTPGLHITPLLHKRRAFTGLIGRTIGERSGIYVLSVLFCLAAAVAQAAPLNDNFENRVLLSGSSVTFTGTLQNATFEPGEPPAENPGTNPWPYFAAVQSASVWWSWTADVSGPVTLEALSWDTNAFKLGGLDVWTGTNWASDFQFVTGVELDSGRHPFVTFSATAGTSYQLRAVGTNFGHFTLRLTQTNVPILMIQPLSRTVTTNESVFFGVVAGGAGPFTYQWRFTGTNLPGETAPILGRDYLRTAQSGDYSVMVSNATGGVISDTAHLLVTDVPAAPELRPVMLSNGQFGLEIRGEVGRFYRIESSMNLSDWPEEKSFPQQFVYYQSPALRPLNGVVYNSGGAFLLPESAQQRFYRAKVYVPVLAACINNLAEVRFAKEAWSLQHDEVSSATASWSDLAPYFNKIPSCPLGEPQCFQCSYAPNQMPIEPVCIVSPTHVLEQPEF